MLESLTKIFEKASSPGDIATVLVFGTAGFVIDAGLNAVGFLEPGYVGIAAASSALGVKKAAEAALTQRRERKTLAGRRENREKRVKNFLALLKNDPAYVDLSLRLERQLKLFELGIIDEDRFDSSVDEIVNDYRSQV